MYSTDLNDAQWKVIKEIQKDERKRKYSLQIIWNAIFYIVKSGCQWGMLPKDFPNWQIVYYYYAKWAEDGTYDLVVDKLRGKARLKKRQNENPSTGILDSQSTRSANNQSLKRVDGNKKIKGIKRHVVVDKNGWLITVMVCVAHIHDSKAALLLLRRLKENMLGIKILIADGGYRGELIDIAKQCFNYIIQIVLRTDQDKNQFKPLPMRWVIERTFAWYDNDRRLCRNYELLLESSEAMVKLASIRHLLNKF